MRDIPIFSTDNGAATLILSKVPYTKEAYIDIKGCSCLDAFIDECRSFCVMAGATQVYAAGDDALEQYTMHCCMAEMCCCKEMLPKTEAILRPVDSDSLEAWLSIYNDKMRDIPAAARLSVADGRQLVSTGKAYYIFERGQMIGIGVAGNDTIEAIASLCPGKGGAVLCALTGVLNSEEIFLRVSTANERAMRLYTRLGFKKTGISKCWYEIL